MFRSTMILIAMVIPALPLAGETPARLVREWKTAAPSPFARVESPTAVVDGKMYLFGGFTDDLAHRTSWMSTTQRPTRGHGKRTCRCGSRT